MLMLLLPQVMASSDWSIVTNSEFMSDAGPKRKENSNDILHQYQITSGTDIDENRSQWWLDSAGSTVPRLWDLSSSFSPFCHLHPTSPTRFLIFSNFQRFCFKVFTLANTSQTPSSPFAVHSRTTVTNCVDCSCIRAWLHPIWMLQLVDRWQPTEPPTHFQLLLFFFSLCSASGSLRRNMRKTVFDAVCYKIHFQGEGGYAGRWRMTTWSVNTVQIYRASNGIMQIEDTVNPHWSKKKGWFLRLWALHVYSCIVRVHVSVLRNRHINPTSSLWRRTIHIYSILHTLTHLLFTP